ncbi:MAG: hypothetical protein ACRDLB_07180 [Actinomycetota bacterium]
MKKRLILGVLLVVATVLIMAPIGLADPNLTNVSPHRHWISTPAGLVQVGPRVCDKPSLQNAFNQFHNNLHVATAGSIGPAAPGLHNSKGAEITATGC